MSIPQSRELLEKLDKPPVDEVVCGVFFRPIPELDPVLIGTYWNARKNEYPKRSVQPAIVDEHIVSVGTVPPLRVWLIHRNDQFVIQIQSNRFYVNWRKRAEEYPSFSGRAGKPGVLAAVLDEYLKFSAFCRQAADVSPIAEHVELTKVDIFTEGDTETDSWRNLADLATMLPWLGPFAAFAVSGEPTFALRFEEHRADGPLTANIGLGMLEGSNVVKRRAVKLETRITKPTTPDGLETAFRNANAELNGFFARLISIDERTKRFQRVAQ